MKKAMFSIIAFLVALVFWFFDSSVHYFIYKELSFELIPSDFNELWMRSIIFLLFILLGIFADFYTRKILIKQKELELALVHKSMIKATYHILNNLLNQMQLFKDETIKLYGKNPDVIKLYDNAINEALEHLEKLSLLKDITENNIHEAAYHGNIGNSPNKTNPTATVKRTHD